MSVTWQMYVDYIKAKGNVEDVMIVDSEDCNHWAGTPDFMVTFILFFYVMFCFISSVNIMRQ